MKKVLKYSLVAISFIILLGIVLHVTSRLFIPKWVDNQDNMYTWIKRGFYAEPENTIDVLISGNSDIYRGISPMVLWEDYGMASYAYSAPGQRIWTGYYMLEEALLYQSPKVIVFGVDAAFSDDDSSSGNYRKVFDNMAFNRVKLSAITDPVFNFNIGEMISFYFPIFRYHSRYNDLTSEDFELAFADYHFAYKGLDLTTKQIPYETGFDYMKDEGKTLEIPSRVKEYLDKIVILCRENNIDLIFVELPSADSWSLARSNAISEYARSQSVPFIDYNLNANETGFDWLTDTSDGGDHLNVYGAEKITRHLGDYLDNYYDIPNHREDAEYSRWHDDYEHYQEGKKQRLDYDGSYISEY